MRHLPTGQTGRTQIQAAPVIQVWRSLVVQACCLAPLAVALLVGCSALPPLKEQERLVQANDLQLERVTTRAVVNAWGKPPHHHSEFTHFFVMPDRTMIPRARVASGEPPKGWDAGVYAGNGVFFAYPDRGWLLVFLDDVLVYREELKPDDMQKLVKAWAYEDRFKTRLDSPPTP